MQYLIAGLICGGLLGYIFGWTGAHRTVATECERLGGFYVGSKVYKCSAVETHPHKGEQL